MIRIIKAEWRKLRRPTLLLGTLGAVVFFSGLVSSLLFLLLDSPQGNGDRGVVITREMLSLPTGATQAFSSVGGLLGMLAIGLLATLTANAAGANGLFFNGGTTQLNRQIIAIVVVALFSFCATWLIATLISKTIGFRVFREDELNGLDTTFHAESAYDITGNSNRY